MWRLAGSIAAVIIGAGMATSCSLVQPLNQPEGVDCADMPSGACQEQSDHFVAAFGGHIRNLSLSCGVAPCTRAHGAGEAKITLDDGQTLTRLWSYVGDSTPIPVPSCANLAPDLCRRILDTVVDDTRPSQRIVAVSISCPGVCTQDEGEVSTDRDPGRREPAVRSAQLVWRVALRIACPLVRSGPRSIASDAGPSPASRARDAPVRSTCPP